MKKMAGMMVVLFALVLLGQAAAEDGLMEITDKHRAASNLFLSNFTEIYGIKADIACHSDDIDLVDFARDHMWYNARDAFEFGEYDNGNNCRVSDDRIQSIIDSYFLYPHQVDLSETRFDYDGEYYYNCETGGSVAAGFAYTVSVCPLGENTYFVSFLIYGGGNDWNNDVMDMSRAEIEEIYGEPDGCGSAIVYTEDVEKREEYRIVALKAI